MPSLSIFMVVQALFGLAAQQDLPDHCLQSACEYCGTMTPRARGGLMGSDACRHVIHYSKRQLLLPRAHQAESNR